MTFSLPDKKVVLFYVSQGKSIFTLHCFRKALKSLFLKAAYQTTDFHIKIKIYVKHGWKFNAKDFYALFLKLA